MNFLAAYFSGKFARLHDLNQSNITSLSGDFSFGIENLGQTSSDFTVNIEPISSNILFRWITSYGIWDVRFRTTIGVYQLYTRSKHSNQRHHYLQSNTHERLPFDSILYEIELEKIYQPTILFADNPDTDGLSNWTPMGGFWSETADSILDLRQLRQ